MLAPLPHCTKNHSISTQRARKTWFLVYGRWGVNHIYGTWSAVSGLALYPDTDDVIKACDWMVKIQNSDGGWGESCDSYDDEKQYAPFLLIPSQTA